MELDVIQVSDEIRQAVRALGEEGQKSASLIEAKAKTSAEYDKYIGIATAKLKAVGEPIGVIEKQVKGEAGELLYAKIVAEESLKAHYSKIDRISAQLNALQSIFRHLSTTTKEM